MCSQNFPPVKDWWKVLDNSTPPKLNSIDQVLVAQSVVGKEYSIGQINAILSKPYLNHRTDDLTNVVDDLMYRGKAIKYALNKFIGEELREMRGKFWAYLTKLEIFEYYWIVLDIKEIEQRLELLRQYINIANKVLKGGKSQVTTEIKKLEANIDREAEQRSFMQLDLEDLAKEIKGLMKSQGF